MKKLSIILCLFALMGCSVDDTGAFRSEDKYMLAGTKWELIYWDNGQGDQLWSGSGDHFYFNFTDGKMLHKVTVIKTSLPDIEMVRYEKKGDVLIITDKQKVVWFKIEEFTEKKLVLNAYEQMDLAYRQKTTITLDRNKFERVN